MVFMSSIGDRLRAERERLGLNQSELAELAGTTRKSQFNYETGARHADTEYLAAAAAAGVDVSYVVTGTRGGAANPLSAEEQTLIEYFRQASKDVRRAAMGALLGATLTPGAGGMSNSGANAVQVGSGTNVTVHAPVYGGVAGRDNNYSAEPPGRRKK